MLPKIGRDAEERVGIGELENRTAASEASDLHVPAGVHLRYRAARNEVRVVGDIDGVIYLGAGHAELVHMCYCGVGRFETLEEALDDLNKLDLVCAAEYSVAESRVVYEVRPVHRCAQLAPNGRINSAYHDAFSAGRGKVAPGSDPGLMRSAAGHVFERDARVYLVDKAVAVDVAVREGYVYKVALAGLFAVIESGRDLSICDIAANEVGQRGAVLLRQSVGFTGGVHHAGYGLRNGVVTALAGVRTSAAIRRYGAVDDFGIDFHYVVVAIAQFVKNTGPIVFNYDVDIRYKCTTAKHALKAQSIGCDMVVADGCECAGHPGEKDIGTMVLTPRCIELLDIPVISAGGIATGKQMAAALVMGAAGVYMGSRFLITRETPVLEKVKQYLVDHATETDTAYLMRAYTNTSRLYNSNVVKKALEIEKAGRPFEDMAELVSGKVSNKMFFENGDVENCGIITYGQSGGLIHEILTCKEVIDGMMKECIEALERFDA